MKQLLLLSFLFISILSNAQLKSINQKVDSLLRLMTIEEKAGQGLNHFN
jgi:hypothetical protein